MSLALLSGAGAALLLVAALASRRPVSVGVAAGLFGGPLLYYLLGGYLAEVRGEGRFYSFPFGGYRIGDAEVLMSVASWAASSGAAAYTVARLVRGRSKD
jgi:hypothetical protein